MGLGALIFLALGISMDNFAVSLGIGTANPIRRVKEHPSYHGKAKKNHQGVHTRGESQAEQSAG
jgi:hypothetical protein